MKINLGYIFLKLLILVILVFSLSSCSFTFWGHESGLYFNESDLPEQDSDSSYIAGDVGPGQKWVKLREKPLINIYVNCKKSNIISFAPSILIHLPPIIPIFFLPISEDRISGQKLKISFSIHEPETNYSFDPAQAVLVLGNQKAFKPEKFKEKTSEEISISSGKTIKTKHQWHELYFDIKCEDLKNLKKGSLLFTGFKYQGRPLDLEAKFYWGSGFYLAWGFLAN